MWRNSVADLAGLLDPAQPAASHGPPRSDHPRVSSRHRLQIADRLCEVARHAAPRARRRRHELLLIPRAAAARPLLLEVAALVRWSVDPDPDCIAELHTLLTSGCDSPLYNADMPAAKLGEALHRARAVLEAHLTPLDPTTSTPGRPPCQ
jgi:hypothetical protein